MKLLALASILGWSRLLWGAGFHYHHAPRLNHMPIITICFLILCTYVGSLLDQLAITVWTLYLIGLTGLVVSITYFAKKRRLEPLWRDPTNIIFVLLSWTALVYFQNSAFVSWDEFSHWGLVAKDIFLRDSLPVAGGPILFASYPPGVPLFQYFFVKAGGFSEGLIYTATSVFVIAGLTTVVPLRKTSKIPLMAAAAFVVLFLIEPFFDWQFAYADHVLGVVFGSSIVIGLDQRSHSSNWLWSLPVLMALVLLKPTGILFAAFAFGIIVTFLLWKAKYRTCESEGHFPHQTTDSASTLLWRNLTIKIFVAVIAIVLVYLSWDSYVTSRFGSVGKKLPSLSDITQSLEGKRLDQDLTTLKAFGGFLIKRAAPFLLCFGGAWFLTRKSSNDETSKARRVVFLAGVLSYIAYLLILLLLYLYSFGTFEGPRLASIGRYTRSFHLGALMVFVFFTFRDYQHIFRRNIYSRVMLAIVLIWSGIGVTKSKVFAGAQGLTADRASIQKIVSPLLTSTVKTDRIFIIWQRSNGYHFNIARYEVYPRKLNSWCWAVGELYVGFDPDVWTCDITGEEFREKLTDFDFVLIGQAYEPFWDRYGSIFSDPTKRSKTGVYKIVYSSEILSLVPIDEK